MKIKCRTMVRRERTFEIAYDNGEEDIAHEFSGKLDGFKPAFEQCTSFVSVLKKQSVEKDGYEYDVPKVGDDVYVGVSDDIHGGKATIKSVHVGISGGYPTIYVSMEGRPSMS